MRDRLLDDVLTVHAGRLVGDGVPVPDVAEAEQALTRWDQWYDYWARKAEAYERLGDEALAAGRRQTAGIMFWYGSMAYHYAQFLWFDEPARREEGQWQKVRLYDRAAPLLVPAAERFCVTVDGMEVPGFLRLPLGVDRAPCVVLVGGLESTKEESYLFENLCLARGLATCAFDGPGQGEFYFQSRLRPDFERFTSAVVDYLSARPEIDAGRIGILGRSLGGYYAVRSAACDPRLKACVAWGALFDLSYFPTMHELTRKGFAYVAGFAEPDAEATAYLQKTIDLSDVASQLTCPLYVLHGRQDHLIPAEQVDRLIDSVQSVELVVDVPDDGNHCCHNIYQIVRPRMADWLAEQLGGRP